jgi:hypothetical protein
MVNTSYRSYSGAILFIFILNFQIFHLHAQTIVPDSLAIERIKYIQNVLEEGTSGANLWWNGWLIGYGAATAGQGIVLISTDDKSTKQDMAAGAATTLLGAVGQLITPMVPGKAADRLKQISGDTPEDRLKKLSYAEELLKTSALREKNGRSWQTHAVAGVVNISSGLVTWLGFKRTVWAGIGNFALNTVITEAQIWTQPTKAMKDYENYCREYYTKDKPSAIKPEMNWYVGIYPGGLSMRIVF